MRTNDLRAQIYSMLHSVCENVYYSVADEGALYPHIVYYIDERRNTADPCIENTIDVHIWGKSDVVSVETVETLCDTVEALFETKNHPLANILPTFYLESRVAVDDEDKKIIHRVIRALSQTYMKE